MEIDYVFTYVNNEDKVWQDNLVKNAVKYNKKINSVRFRDWHTLPFLLRGIENCMPWIRNVYMIVESPTQVPDYINTDTVHVIYHNQIIPKEYLPTYNSNLIEMFMYKIPGLSEYFIYGNDDMFPILKTTPDMWYTEDGLPKIKVKLKHRKPHNIYTQTLKNTENLCLKELNRPFIKMQLLRSDHSINPMLKSTWEMFWKKHEKTMKESLTMFRSNKNITQELSNFYHFLSNKCEIHNRNTKYFDCAKTHTLILKNILKEKNIHCICINDNDILDFKTSQKKVCEIFNEKFPNKSKYEL